MPPGSTEPGAPNGGATLDELIHGLARPDAYAHPVDAVQVVQTHASAVFLAGDEVYKVKKPVDLGFLDYSTPKRRLDNCRKEVDLNRRLAPDVYVDVVPVTRDATGLRIGGDGPVVEHAVHMHRLPDDRTLEALVAAGRVGPDEIGGIARRLARFHAEAAAGPEIARFGRVEVVEHNCIENFEQLEPLVDDPRERELLARLRALTEAELAVRRPTIEARARAGVPRDTHGDLRLDHVYLLPGRAADEPVIIDCIEFNERFRYEDPVADIAFLVMDLRAHGAWSLADELVDAYFAAAGDAEGRELLPLYTAYRATVRAKVDVLTAREPEVPAAARRAASRRSRAHMRLALAELLPPGERPGLVVVAGLPGTGKSTLAGRLASDADFEWIRSDVVRKQLAGLRPEESGGDAFGAGIYTSEWTDRTYAECLARAQDVLARGGRAVVDANFRSHARRVPFFDAARDWGVRAFLVVCELPPELVKSRLAARHGDASDADWSIYERARADWEPIAATMPCLRVETSGTPREAVETALEGLRDAGLSE